MSLTGESSGCPRAKSSTGLRCHRMILMCFALAAVGPLSMAHETDQYTVPTGRQFADLRFWLSEYVYDRLSAAVEVTNERIKRSLRDGQPTSATARAQSPDDLAWQVLLEFPPVINYVEVLDGQLRGPKVRSRFPGLVTSYLPTQCIYNHPLLLLDITKLPRLARASTIMVNGSYFGTDKYVHCIHMGYLYFRAYRQALASGRSEEEAIRVAVNEGAGSGIISENNLLGFLPTGVISNGDKAADYVGMKFYQNLTAPVMLKGSLHPPLLVRDGEFFKFNDHVCRGNDFFSVYVSDHWNEALLPNTYGAGIGQCVMEEVRSRCGDLLAFYRDANGHPYSKADFRRIAEGLTTYYGEDYGFDGNLDDMVSIITACFDDERAPKSAPIAGAQSLERDSLGRNSLWRATRAGQATEVASLVRADRINQADIDGETPLFAAVRGGSPEIVHQILKAGAEVNIANRNGVTPLHLAAQNDSSEIVEALLTHGAHVESRDAFGCTPLHDAARRGSPSVVSMLLKAGAKAETFDNFGTTPLHRAARAGRVDNLQLLLASGASAQATNQFGNTPLDEAKASHSRQAAEILSRVPAPSHEAQARPVDHRVPLVAAPNTP